MERRERASGAAHGPRRAPTTDGARGPVRRAEEHRRLAAGPGRNARMAFYRPPLSRRMLSVTHSTARHGETDDAAGGERDAAGTPQSISGSRRRCRRDHRPGEAATRSTDARRHVIARVITRASTRRRRRRTSASSSPNQAGTPRRARAEDRRRVGPGRRDSCSEQLCSSPRITPARWRLDRAAAAASLASLDRTAKASCCRVGRPPVRSVNGVSRTLLRGEQPDIARATRIGTPRCR